MTKNNYLPIKSIIDFSLGLFLLILSLPLFLIISLLVRLGSDGEAILKQKRVGYKKKLFVLYKFRTMWNNAQQLYPDLYKFKYTKLDLSRRPMRSPNDPRVTGIGRFLRKYSLDELPNLINVLKGEMSLVGPRPELKEMMKYYSKRQLTRFSVKPGMTGYAQIHGRDSLTQDQTIKYDLKYVKEQSFITDLKILVKTIPVVIKAAGAF